MRTVHRYPPRATRALARPCPLWGYRFACPAGHPGLAPPCTMLGRTRAAEGATTMDLEYSEPPSKAHIDRIVLEIEGEAEPTILVTAHDTLAGLNDEARQASVRQALHRLHLAA